VSSLLATAFVLAGCNEKPACTPGTTLECVCPDGNGAQVCNETGSGYGACSCSGTARGDGPVAAEKPAATDERAPAEAANATERAIAAKTANVAKASKASAGAAADKLTDTENAAKTAYRDVIGAFNKYDADTYFNGFDDELCFYSRLMSRARLRSVRGSLFKKKTMRLTTALEVLRATPDEVLLWDHGTWGSQGKAPKPHNKLILMKRDTEANGWLVAVEASAKKHACAPGLLDGVPDSLRAKVGDTTRAGELVRHDMAKLHAKHLLCFGEGRGDDLRELCIVETAERKPSGVNERTEKVTGYVTLQTAKEVKRLMTLATVFNEGAAGHLYTTFAGKGGRSKVKLSYCNFCEPPGYDDLTVEGVDKADTLGGFRVTEDRRAD
jgi:hypothetical protein